MYTLHHNEFWIFDLFFDYFYPFQEYFFTFYNTKHVPHYLPLVWHYYLLHHFVYLFWIFLCENIISSSFFPIWRLNHKRNLFDKTLQGKLPRTTKLNINNQACLRKPTVYSTKYTIWIHLGSPYKDDSRYNFSFCSWCSYIFPS